jgi:hypothetical protein
MENKNERAVYKLDFDCGRNGELRGLFIAKKNHVKILVDRKIEVYFGEVLGKHSEVCGPIESSEIIFVSDDENVIKVIEDNDLQNGFNPFDYTSSGLGREEFDDLTVGEIIEILEKES